MSESRAEPIQRDGSTSRITRSAFLSRGLGLATASLTLPGLLAACGGTAAGRAVGGGGNGAKGPISYLDHDLADTTSGVAQALRQIAQRWNAAHPDARVTLEGVPFANVLATATTRARAGKLADVVGMLPDNNFSPLFPALARFRASDFGDLATVLTGWHATVPDVAQPDVHIAVPLGGEGIVWYFNRALFDKAGLDVDKPPTTWEEFLAAAAALKAKGITPIGMNAGDTFFPWWMWMSFCPQAFPSIDEVFATRSGEIKLTDARFLHTLQPVEETYRKGWWNSDWRDLKFDGVEAKFIKGEVAMVCGLIGSLSNWTLWDQKLGKDAYGVFAAPLLPGYDKQGQFYNPIHMIGINKDSAHRGSAHEFIELLVSRDSQIALLRNGGAFPNRHDIDVAAVTKSPAAAAIRGIIDKLGGGIDVPQTQFNGAATQTALAKLAPAIASGNLKQYLNDLQTQQAA